ncbi:MAG: exodeoxyribonuclease V subunit gamma [Oscillospiraceae bacterium]|nr:exodeoxyribonuclease V subunit gamma [Oscillospiraceae bacterium]
MLQYLIGSAGTGKSTEIAHRIGELAGSGKKCILMVPEQFSKTAETLMVTSLEGKRLEFAQLYTFEQLIRKAGEKCMELNGMLLDDARKTVMAHRALQQVKGSLDIYRKQSENFGFSSSLVSVFDNLHRSGLDHETLARVLDEDGRDHRKLEEISSIYTEYSVNVSTKFTDRETQLELLAQNLPQELFLGASVFIDGFESFSHGQLSVIEAILETADSVTIAMTCDEVWDRTMGTGPFSYVQSTIRQIDRMAKRAGVHREPAQVLRNPYRFRNDDLLNVDRYLRGAQEEREQPEHVYITKFNTQYDEVSFAAAKILSLIRENKLSYKDIAVICPQLDKYENQIQESFTLAGIPYFIDMNRIISSARPVMLFKSIFAIMHSGLGSEDLMSLLMTGLTDLSEDDINLLDNYLFLWQDLDFDFSEPFTLSPFGLNKDKSSEDKAVLERINSVRERIYAAFDGKFAIRGARPAREMIEEAYRIAVSLGCTDRIRELADSMPGEEERNLLLRQWEAAMDCLDSLHEILLPDSVKRSDIEDLFTIMTNNRTIGFAPETRDCVIVTEPKRMKLDAVEAVFILGADSENFPVAVSEDSLISVTDREFLKSKNYPLRNDFENLFSFENFYFYKTLTTAREWLYISVADRNLDAKQNFSIQIEAMKEKLHIREASLKLEEYRVTRPFFLDYVSQLAGGRNREAMARLLEKAAIKVPAIPHRSFNISDSGYLSALLGRSLRISPSRAQDFYKCRFMYFMKSILRIDPVEKARFDPRVAGTYLHYVAQKLLEEHGDGFRSMTFEEIETDVRRLMDEFINETYPPEIRDNVRFTSQFENMTKNAVNFMKYVWNEQQTSLFRPIAFEEKIEEGSRVSPLAIHTPLGHMAKVIGVADRVDIYHGSDRDWIRVVDYKTGTQKFDLDEIYNGLSSQMLLYMDALVRAGFGGTEAGVSPAAVMYQPSDIRGKFDKSDESHYTAIGMAVNEKEIANAFNSDSGNSYGVIYLKDGKVTRGKDSKVVSRDVFGRVLEFVKESIANMADCIYSGDYVPEALELGNDNTPCSYCPYGAMCHHSQLTRKMLKNDFLPKKK